MDPGRNFFTEHLRHDHIGQEQVDHSRVTFDQGNRLGAVRAREYDVAIARKDPPHHVSQSVLVFNDKNRLGPVEIARFSGGTTDCRSPVGGREQYSTGRPDTGFGVELDLPTGLSDNSEHRRQSEAGALAAGLGREERLKDVVEHGLLHARAGVTDSQPDVVTRCQSRIGLCVCLVDFAVLSVDGEETPVGHRITRVHRQVHEHLFKLSGVCFHERRICRERDDELDVFADRSTEELLDSNNYLVQVEYHRLQYLPASEREELACEFGCAFGRHADLPKIILSCFFVIELFAHERRIVRNNGQKIIEVVRNTSGELAKTLHALRLMKLPLKTLVFDFRFQTPTFGFGLLAFVRDTFDFGFKTLAFGFGFKTLALDFGFEAHTFGLGFEAHAFGFLLLPLGRDAIGFGFEAHAFGFLLLPLGRDASGFDFEAHAFGFGLDSNAFGLNLTHFSGVSNRC